MALITSPGIRTTDLFGNLTRYQDISPVMASYLYREQALLGLTPVGEDFVGNSFSWNEDKLNPDSFTDLTGAGNTSADTVISVSASDIQILKTGMIAQVNTRVNIGEQVQIKAINQPALQITLSRGYGGTATESWSSNTVLRIIGEPSAENSQLTKDTTRARIAKTNFIHRWEFTIILSAEVIVTSLLSYTPGVANELGYQFKKQMDERRRTMQNSWWASINSTASPASTGGDYSTMIGVWKWLDGTANTTSQVGPTSGSLNPATVNSMVQFIVNQGTTPQVLAMGTNGVGRFSLLGSDLVRTGWDETSQGKTTKYYQTPYGPELRIVLDPFLNDTVGSLQCGVLDMSKIRLKFFAGAMLYTIMAENFMDGDALTCHSKPSLEVRNSGLDIGQAHQIAYGLS